MRDLFSHDRALIGVVHLQALPGTPHNTLNPQQIVEQALAEAEVLKEAGFDAIILENMHDRPYLNKAVGPEVVATMSRACSEVRKITTLPLGVQILAGANQEAVAVAHAGGADFVRVEGFVFGHLADEGMIEASAGPLLRYRKAIGAGKVKILCDIKKKHGSHAITSDVSLAETAKAAEFFSADGLVVTGVATGEETAVADLTEVASATDLPVWIGSGITLENLAAYRLAHGLIVGSWTKERGDWRRPVDPERCARLVEAFRTQDVPSRG
jgi:membrane complex biogenesis BtpA family protein